MPLFTKDTLAKLAEEVNMKDEARVPVDTSEERTELSNAMEVIRLVREALYDLEWVYVPDSGVNDEDKIFNILEVKLNYAKEATALLPEALSVMTKYISSGE
jgi:hypothetical protein